LRIAPFMGVRRGTQNTPPIHGEHYKKVHGMFWRGSSTKNEFSFLKFGE